MRIPWAFGLALAGGGLLAALPAPGQPDTSAQRDAALSVDRHVIRIVVDGAISPASAEFIQNAIEEAGDTEAEALVILLDTPGGLVESTREIVRSMIAPQLMHFQA